MAKRRKGDRQPGVLQGAAATILTLMGLLGALALAVQKGTAGEGMIGPGVILSCLAAGTAGVIWGPKGEGSGKRRLLTSTVPAAALLILSLLFVRETKGLLRGALHAICLFLPCLLSVAAGRKRFGKSRAGRRMRHLGAMRR